MYLVKRCCDRTLPEMAKEFVVGGYSTVSWSYRVIEARMVKERSSEIGSKRSLPVLINSILDPFLPPLNAKAVSLWMTFVCFH
jgi:hypothetical protein